MSFACSSNRPTDKEMIEHFERHEKAFEELRTILVATESGGHYPLYGFDDRDTCVMSELSTQGQERLDHLLAYVGVSRAFFGGKPCDSLFLSSYLQRQDEFGKDIRLPYHSAGLSISGTVKGFVYDPSLSERLRREEDLSTEEREDRFGLFHVLVDDLDVSMAKYWQDLSFYRRIKGDWYLYLERDN